MRDAYIARLTNIESVVSRYHGQEAAVVQSLQQQTQPTAVAAISTGSALPPIVLVLLCYNRPAMLEKTLNSIIKYSGSCFLLLATAMRAVHCFPICCLQSRVRPSVNEWPLIVSQDGTHAGVAAIIQKYLASGDIQKHIQFDWQQRRQSTAGLQKIDNPRWVWIIVITRNPGSVGRFIAFFLRMYVV